MRRYEQVGAVHIIKEVNDMKEILDRFRLIGLDPGGRRELKRKIDEEIFFSSILDWQRENISEDLQDLALFNAKDGNLGWAVMCLDEMEAVGEQVTPELKWEVMALGYEKQTNRLINLAVIMRDYLSGDAKPVLQEELRDRMNKIKIGLDELMESELKKEKI